MAILPILPHELLLEIISQLQHDKQSLLSLALVAKPFDRLTQEYIFRHIRLGGNHRKPGNQVRGRRQKLLLRTLLDNPGLCKHIWSYDAVGIVAVPEAARPIFAFTTPAYAQVLGLFSHLKRIKMKIHFFTSIRGIHIGPADKDAIDVHTCLSQLKLLETITLSGFVWSRDLAAFMRLNVQNAVVCDTSMPGIGSRIEGIESSQSLRRLILKGDIWPEESRARLGICPPSSLPQLLDLCRNLEHLRVDLEGVPPRINVVSPVARWSKEIKRGLSIVRETLKHLEITFPSGDFVTDTNPAINLSGLPVLKILKINSYMLFSLNEQAEGREGIVEYLPLSLEELYIAFPSEIPVLGRLFAKQELVDDDGSPLQVENHRRFNWMFQFPEAKRTSHTSLEKVILSDIADGLKGHYIQWDPPAHLSDAYHRERIELTVRLFCVGSWH